MSIPYNTAFVFSDVFLQRRCEKTASNRSEFQEFGTCSFLKRLSGGERSERCS